MTTNLTITNNGPGRVRLRRRDICLSARGADRDSSERVLEVGETLTYECVYGNERKLLLEEVIEDDDKGLGRR